MKPYEEKPPHGVRSPKNLRQARRRLSKVKDDMKSIELQLADPNITDKEGTRLNKKEWERWRSRALHALHRKQMEYSYLDRWLTDQRTRIRALEAGVIEADNPNAYLAHSLRLLRKCRKHVDAPLPRDLHDEAGRVADAIESYLMLEAEAI